MSSDPTSTSYHPVLLVFGMVYKKIKIFNFFGKAQKRSKLSENDIYMYLRLSPKYGAKPPSQKKLWGSKVDDDDDEIAFLLVITITVHVYFVGIK